jgi:hypothetical protein
MASLAAELLHLPDKPDKPAGVATKRTRHALLTQTSECGVRI